MVISSSHSIARPKRMVCNSVSAIQIALAPCLKLFMRGAAWRQAFVPSCKASRADQVGHNHARLVYIRDFVCMCPDEGAYLVNEKLLDGIFQISHSIIQPERFFKNPKAWGPGPLKFLFLNASKIKLQEAEGPSNSSGILSYVLHASAQFGAGLNEVTRWSWQIWQEACEKMIF